MLSFWYQLLLCEDKLSNSIYRKLLFINNNGKNMSWITEIKNLLNNTGFCNIWNSQALNINKNWLCKAVEFKLKDQFLQT